LGKGAGRKALQHRAAGLGGLPGGNGAQLLVGLRRQRGLSQKLLAPKAGGLNQARLSALELHPGRFTVERLLMILAAQADTRVSDLVFRTAGVITAV